MEGRDLEGLERRAMDGGVAVGRIENIPLAARRLDEKRETRVAHAPAERHAPERGGVVKAVALGVVGPPGDERLDQMGQILRVHLAVGVHLDADVRAVGERLLVAGDGRGSDAAVLLTTQQTDAPVAHGADFRSGLVGTRIVYGVDRVDPRRNSREHALDRFRRAVGRNHDGDLQSLNAHGRCSRTALGAGTAAVEAARCGSNRRSAKAAASAAAPRISSGSLSGAARYSAVTRCWPAGTSKPMKLVDTMKVGVSRPSTRTRDAHLHG